MCGTAIWYLFTEATNCAAEMCDWNSPPPRLFSVSLSFFRWLSRQLARAFVLLLRLPRRNKTYRGSVFWVWYVCVSFVINPYVELSFLHSLPISLVGTAQINSYELCVLFNNLIHMAVSNSTKKFIAACSRSDYYPLNLPLYGSNIGSLQAHRALLLENAPYLFHLASKIPVLELQAIANPKDSGGF